MIFHIRIGDSDKNNGCFFQNEYDLDTMTVKSYFISFKDGVSNKVELPIVFNDKVCAELGTIFLKIESEMIEQIFKGKS